MERLTSTRPWSDAQNDLSNEPGNSYIWQKLQRYEDTGLEPDEIIALCDMDRRAKIADMLRLEESAGISIDRLRELARADREGRVKIDPKALKCPKCGKMRLFPRIDWKYYYCYSCKTQFTREAAEAALKEREAEHE